jgi:hypothetical protein
MGLGLVYLQEPITTKNPTDGTSPILDFGATEMQGWRKSMEDAHINLVNFDDDPKSALFAVFDGHGGMFVFDNYFRKASC